MEEDPKRIMVERFGKDTVISLATVEDGVPYVRYTSYGSLWEVSFTLKEF